jgi:hypothetical protein
VRARLRRFTAGTVALGVLLIFAVATGLWALDRDRQHEQDVERIRNEQVAALLDLERRSCAARHRIVQEILTILREQRRATANSDFPDLTPAQQNRFELSRAEALVRIDRSIDRLSSADCLGVPPLPDHDV